MLINNLDELIKVLQEAKEHYVNGKADIRVYQTNNDKYSESNFTGYVWKVEYDSDKIYIVITCETDED